MVFRQKLRITLMQRKAFSTRGCANGIATLRDAIRVRLERVFVPLSGSKLARASPRERHYEYSN
ncbi:hypothetical protein [Nostoc sp.]|uniref:hypothetical protein n=1 Tax=Nostoc sp. TaxID=1180 RepID=UPI002FF8C472